MNPFLCVLLLLSAVAHPAVINPIVTTDKSVNTYSVKTIAADLIKPGMSDEEKLLALFHYHRRVMHHFRLQQATEDPSQNAGFDLIRLYTVYGSAWCTQNVAVFNTLCAEVFGRGNTEGTAGSGILASKGTSGGHSSFHVRYNAADKWHWIDPIVGAYARNRTDGSIASFEEIVADPAILLDAEKDGRASVPYFPCTKGINPISAATTSAYSYFDYDTAFIADFAAAWTKNAYTNFPAYFTTRKILQKGEQYLFLWDFLPGDYFNLQDKEFGASRTWSGYPPRHLCGWKDSLDTVNWPYFKPYKKVINGDTCYRYYANGMHTFAPDLSTDDPKDSPILKSNVSFFADDPSGPGIKPLYPDSLAQIVWRLKLPYPLMSMRVVCDFTKTNTGDSLALYMKRLTLGIGSYPDLGNDVYPNHLDTLTPDASWKCIKSFPVQASGSLDTVIRAYVDPVNTAKTYQGYMVMLVMKTAGATSGVGVNRLKIESIFQHNMFALPQLEPGANLVTVSADSGIPPEANAKVAFSWTDNGVDKVDVRNITAAGQTFTLTVDQTEMPRMQYMAIGNTRDPSFGQPIRVDTVPETVSMNRDLNAYPNPFNPTVHFLLSGMAHTRLSSEKTVLSIYSPTGKVVKTIHLNPGEAEASWNAAGFSSGVYLAVVKQGTTSLSRKIVLVK